MTDNEIRDKFLNAFEWLEKIKESNPSDENYINADIIQKFINCYQKEINCQKATIERQVKAIQEGYSLSTKQKSEIERLNKILENRGEICKLCEGKYTEKIKRAKSEAIKEFAHLLIDKAKKGVIYAMDIPDYVKEMVGD